MSEFRGKHVERLREMADTEEYKAVERATAIEAARAEERERIANFVESQDQSDLDGYAVADAIRSLE